MARESLYFIVHLYDAILVYKSPDKWPGSLTNFPDPVIFYPTHLTQRRNIYSVPICADRPEKHNLRVRSCLSRKQFSIGVTLHYFLRQASWKCTERYELYHHSCLDVCHVAAGY